MREMDGFVTVKVVEEEEKGEKVDSRQWTVDTKDMYNIHLSASCECVCSVYACDKVKE